MEPVEYQSKFVLSDSSRHLYMSRILPISFWGCLIWLMSEILFGYIFLMEEMRVFFITAYLLLLPLCVMILFISYFQARKGNNKSSLILLGCFCLCSGILGVPILLWSGKFNVFIYVALSLGIGGVGIVYLAVFFLSITFLLQEHSGFI